MSIRVEVTLSNREALAVLKSAGLSAGHGVKMSLALRKAEMKLIGAISSAVADAGVSA